MIRQVRRAHPLRALVHEEVRDDPSDRGEGEHDQYDDGSRRQALGPPEVVDGLSQLTIIVFE